MLRDVFRTVDLPAEPAFIVTRDILYADDTLLLSRHAENLNGLLAAIVVEGEKYGLELNWEKTVQINISTDSRISRPTGEPIKSVREAVYLGGLITCDGKATTEVTRRLGEATNFSSCCTGFGRTRQLGNNENA